MKAPWRQCVAEKDKQHGQRSFFRKRMSITVRFFPAKEYLCRQYMTTRILFVCHGNICRSPMAEFILKALVKTHGQEKGWLIESAAVSTEEIGNPIYPPAKRCLAQHRPTTTASTASSAWMPPTFGSSEESSPTTLRGKYT